MAASIGPISSAAGKAASSSAPAKSAEMTSRKSHCQGLLSRFMRSMAGWSEDGCSASESMFWS
ncbi:hypothetical protein X739_02735 [Mesorhizobium sp. LNHC220B00]|nr:hypothetical protein X739_02735 [Mesorhizobium sp. LNHC220B00]